MFFLCTKPYRVDRVFLTPKISTLFSIYKEAFITIDSCQDHCRLIESGTGKVRQKNLFKWGLGIVIDLTLHYYRWV